MKKINLQMLIGDKHKMVKQKTEFKTQISECHVNFFQFQGCKNERLCRLYAILFQFS